MKNCNVSDSKHNGLLVEDGGLMTIYGNDTTITNNSSTSPYYYGLEVSSSSCSIHLVSPLTIEISKNNGGGRNYAGAGTIAIVDNEGKIIETIQEAEPEEQNDVGPLDTDEDYYAPRLRF